MGNCMPAEPYDIVIESKLERLLLKLRKKDPVVHRKTIKKMLKICENPRVGKPLRYALRGIWRVHIGSFVLMYEIDDKNRKLFSLRCSREIPRL